MFRKGRVGKKHSFKKPALKYFQFLSLVILTCLLLNNPWAPSYNHLSLRFSSMWLSPDKRPSPFELFHLSFPPTVPKARDALILQYICTNPQPPLTSSLPMEKNPSWLMFFLLFLLLGASRVSSERTDVKLLLIGFLRTLADNNTQVLKTINWKPSSDPCTDGWTGITCNNITNSVRIIDLENLGLTGTIDAGLLCKVRSLTVLSLHNNSLRGEIPTEISNCSQLTHLYISDNRLTGSLPSSLPDLNNLKRFDISGNDFSGELPDLAKISGLVTFLAQNNHLNGPIPAFDFSNLQQFNISNNNFTGPIPQHGDKFSSASFLGNFGLCGKPLSSDCPPAAPVAKKKSKASSWEQAIMFSGYIVLGLAFLLFFAYKLMYKKKSGGKSEGKTSSSNEKNSRSRSEYSLPSNDTVPISSSLFILRNPATKELKFEDLLKAPAELLGRGRYGSLYKVMLEDWTPMVVKRIKDLTVPAEVFHKRMERLDKLRHRNVLSAVAFYCSKQEKLVVYEYQQNGSLFKLLHGSHDSQSFDWGSRLSVASGIAEGLAFMHGDLHEDVIAHGNLKSSNILMDSHMDPCISEYGLMATDSQNHSPLSSGSSNKNNQQDTGGMHKEAVLKADVYGFGVILLELLTGKLVQSNGFDLANWVRSVVREEWTVEVFDKVLMGNGASEERMVNLLQVALKCMDPSPVARPSMSQVAGMINTIREEDERSLAYSTEA